MCVAHTTSSHCVPPSPSSGPDDFQTDHLQCSISEGRDVGGHVAHCSEVEGGISVEGRVRVRLHEVQ